MVFFLLSNTLFQHFPHFLSGKHGISKQEVRESQELERSNVTFYPKLETLAQPPSKKVTCCASPTL